MTSANSQGTITLWEKGSEGDTKWCPQLGVCVILPNKSLDAQISKSQSQQLEIAIIDQVEMAECQQNYNQTGL